MNSKINASLVLAFTILIVSFSACSDKKEDRLKNLPQDVKPITEAIILDSPSQFASAMTYPIDRPYPLPPVKDSAEMVNYYSTLVDNEFKDKISQAVDSLWYLDGWKGWTLDDGSYLWIDSGKVYAIDYVSQRETMMLDSLRGVELKSLDPSLRDGWTPVMCVVDTIKGDIFRIDFDRTKTPPLYRLAGYQANSNLSAAPSILLYGSLDEEGSAGTRLFHFADSVGTVAEYLPDILDTDSIPVIEVSGKGKIQRFHVKPSRWLSHVKDSTTNDNIVVERVDSADTTDSSTVIE